MKFAALGLETGTWSASMRPLLLTACICAFGWIAMERSAEADPRAMAMQGAWLQAKVQNQTVSHGGMSFPSWSPWAAKAQAANVNMNMNMNKVTTSPQRPITRQQASHRELCLRAAWLNKQRPPSTAELDKCVTAAVKAAQEKGDQREGPSCDAPSDGQTGRMKICVPTALPISKPRPSKPATTKAMKRPPGLGPTHYTPPKNQPTPRQSTLVALELLKMVGLERLAQQQTEKRCTAEPSFFGADL